MKATVENGELVIRIPLEAPRPSSTGKTLIVASTGGNVLTTAKVDGKPITLGLKCLRAQRCVAGIAPQRIERPGRRGRPGSLQWNA